MNSSRDVTNPKKRARSPLPQRGSGWDMPPKKGQKATKRYVDDENNHRTVQVQRVLSGQPMDEFPGMVEICWDNTGSGHIVVVATIPWHVVCLHSEWFRTLYESGMVERQTNRIVIRDVPCNVVEELVAFFLQGYPTLERGVDDALVLYNAANMYDLEFVKDWFKEHAICKDNLAIVATLGDTYPDLRDTCKQVISARSMQPRTFMLRHFKAMSCGACETLVQGFLSRSISPGNEVSTDHQDLFRFIHKWMTSNERSGFEQVTNKAKELVRTYINVRKLGIAFAREEARPTGLLPEPFQIFVKGLTGKTRVISVKFFETVESLRLMVQEQEGVSPKDQRLIFTGKQLEDGRVLEDYNIEKEGTLHLCMRLLSGPYVP